MRRFLGGYIMSLEVESNQVDYYKAGDGRIIAIHIKGDFP